MLTALLLTTLAHADLLRVTVELRQGESVPVHGIRLPGQAVATPGPLVVVDADGRVLATAALPSTMGHRSLLTPSGAHHEATPTARRVHVDVPWPEAATAAWMDDTRLPILAAPGEGPVLVSHGTPGPQEARLDLVIVADGYTADGEDDFDADVDAFLTHLDTIEPWATFPHLLNVWSAWTPSRESGLGDGLVPGDHDTSFACEAGCGDEGVASSPLVCCDEARLTTFLDEAAPGAEALLVLSDDPRFGGSGGALYAVTTTGHDAWLQVATHEISHTLAVLWDEYGYGTDAPDDAPRSPNCAPAGRAVPWEAWTDGPIDWPAWEELVDDRDLRACDGRAGAGQEGDVCAYAVCSFTDYVRPTFEHCMMSSLQDRYCPVCAEAIVRRLYRETGDTLVSAEPPPGTPLRPGDRVVATSSIPADGLSWRWTLGGAPLPDTTPSLTLPSVPTGELVLTVSDASGFVRSDPPSDATRRLIWPTAEEAAPCGCATGTPSWTWLLVLWAARRRSRPC